MTGPQIVEVTLPGARTEDLHRWAAGLESENPIALGPDRYGALEWTGQPFMGVELTLRGAKEDVLVLVVFADVPTDAEVAEMNEPATPVRMNGSHHG